MAAPSPDELRYMKVHINDTKVPSVLSANIVCVVLAYIAVSLRFISRRLIKVKLWADDWLIVAALIAYTGFIVAFSATTAFGAGRHIILVTNPMVLSQLNLADEVIYSAAMLLIKYSLLSLYGRIFAVPQFRKNLYLVAALVAGCFLASGFASIFQCVPVSLLWDPTQSGYCIDYGLLVLIISIIIVVTDFIILLLPVRLVLNLHLKRTKRISIMLTFFAGSLTCIVSIVRLASTLQVDPKDSDLSWNEMTAGILSSVELFVGITAACIPTYQPLFRRLLRRDAETINSDRAGASAGPYGSRQGSRIPGKGRSEFIPLAGEINKTVDLSVQRTEAEDDEERLTTTSAWVEAPM